MLCWRHMSQQQFSSCDKPLFAKKKFCCGENLSPQHIAWNFPGLNVCVAKQQQNDPNINVASKWALILQNVPLQHICMPLSASYAPACTLSLTMLLILTHQACPRNISSSVPTFESIPQVFPRLRPVLFFPANVSRFSDFEDSWSRLNIFSTVKPFQCFPAPIAHFTVCRAQVS